jgi:hypothetical protein
MKKLTKVLFAILIGFAVNANVMAQTTFVAPTNGSGTQGDPYEIGTIANLAWITASNLDVPSPNKLTRWGSYYIQTADIDAIGTNSWNSGEGFSPIGNSTDKFTGGYDGGFYYINGLYMVRTTEACQAMCGMISGATIKNIALTECYIKGQNFIGSIVGWSELPLSTIETCYASGDIFGENYVGGLVGNAASLNVLNSYSLCNVESYYLNGYIGGLIGYTSSDITNCYSAGLVTVYLTSTSNYGGFMGGSSGLVMDCYWDTETSGQLSTPDLGSAYGYTTSMMQQEMNFGMWDFNDVWLINDGFSYPYLNPGAPTPTPSVPVSDWAIYFGIFLIAVFMVVRYKKAQLA